MKKMFLIAMILIMMLSSVCFANLQSRPDRARLINQKANDFFIKARNMEASGGVLGKSASINSSTGFEETGANNIDAHMMKNTEYGAAAILSISQYGYQSAVPMQGGTYTSDSNYTLGDSTTGPTNNKPVSYYYGLFDMANTNTNGGKYTITATMHMETDSSSTNFDKYSILNNAANTNDLKKYVDIYSTGIPKSGDATEETKKWRDTLMAGFVGKNYPLFSRHGGMFGYDNNTGNATTNFTTRAVVVCGSGI